MTETVAPAVAEKIAPSPVATLESFAPAPGIIAACDDFSDLFAGAGAARPHTISPGVLTRKIGIYATLMLRPQAPGNGCFFSGRIIFLENGVLTATIPFAVSGDYNNLAGGTRLDIYTGEKTLPFVGARNVRNAFTDNSTPGIPAADRDGSKSFSPNPAADTGEFMFPAAAVNAALGITNSADLLLGKTFQLGFFEIAVSANAARIIIDDFGILPGYVNGAVAGAVQCVVISHKGTRRDSYSASFED